MGKVQRRKGPNTVGFWGLLQPIGDGLKLFIKEIIIPKRANVILFFSSSCLFLILHLIQWGVLPFDWVIFISNIDIAILYSLAISSLSIYGLIGAGWSSNSKYSFLGSLRATAQMLSYELSLSLIILTIIFISKSFNYTKIIISQQNIILFFPLLPLFISFLIIMLAETNRTPFDLAEAEAELVGGYNTEYSGIIFALFFLGEYGNMLFLSFLTVILFFGGWLTGSEIFIFKVLVVLSFFIMIRATLPRYRYDQLMTIGWKILLPFIFGYFIFIVGILLFFQGILDFQTFPYLNELMDFNYYYYKSVEKPFFIINQLNLNNLNLLVDNIIENQTKYNNIYVFNEAYSFLNTISFFDE
jgi:NADH-quinone oxidoreductase subunit H